MIVFGLTGGIASGKSTVTKTFRRIGVPIIDADQIARDVVVPGSKGLQQIVDEFSPLMLLPDGTLNRKRLGTLVFLYPDSMGKLNKIMSPLIQEESERQVQRAYQDGHEVIGYDAALIFEMGNAERYDPIIVVHCSPENQLGRLMKRNDLTESEAVARISAQMPVAEKIKRADWTINTDGSVEQSIKQTETIFLCLRNKLREQRMSEKEKR
jgi:dephospho-CoA kinase